MIKKVLFVGKNVYLLSKAPDAHVDQGMSIDINMPLEVFWQLEELMKQFDYLQSSNEPQGESKAVLREVFKICSQFAVLEKDRTWLYGRAQE